MAVAVVCWGGTVSGRSTLLRVGAAAVVVTVASTLAVVIGSATPAVAATVTTAWRNGVFVKDVGGIVSRSNVVVGRPNSSATQFLPLGNGALGVAAWAGNGFT